jgi:protein-arginine kinase
LPDIYVSKILEQTEQENSERLMAKARLANRLAKKSHGSNRQMAYHIKSAALSSLVKKLSNHIRVSKDIKLNDFIVVELKREQSGLHLPFAKSVN